MKLSPAARKWVRGVVDYGGLVAFLLQWGLYSLIVSKIMSTMAAGIITVLPFASVALPLLLVFLGVGVLVGVFGGLTAIRNYLKV